MFPASRLLSSQALAGLISPLRGADSGYQIVERGEDFALHRKIVALTNETGAVSFHTNEFTVLDHGLHYFEAGEWRASRDVVESFPDGAIARFGPCKAIFSPDMHSETVFDIAMPDEQRIRGGVRAIQLTDIATGKSVILATVKQSAWTTTAFT